MSERPALMHMVTDEEASRYLADLERHAYLDPDHVLALLDTREALVQALDFALDSLHEHYFPDSERFESAARHELGVLRAAKGRDK